MLEAAALGFLIGVLAVCLATLWALPSTPPSERTDPETGQVFRSVKDLRQAIADRDLEFIIPDDLDFHPGPVAEVERGAILPFNRLSIWWHTRRTGHTVKVTLQRPLLVWAPDARYRVESCTGCDRTWTWGR